MSATQATQAEFQMAGKPLAQPIYLVDQYGNPITGSNPLAASGSNASVGVDGSALPTSSTLLGGSDGTNLQQLLVESSSNRNLRIGVYSGANEATVTGANALKVDGSAATQPVSGTLTANIGTTNGVALDTSVNGVLVSQGSTTS